MSYEEEDAKGRKERPVLDPRIERFSERLRALAEKSSVRALARKAGLSEGVLRNYLRGDTYPTLDRLAAIAEAAGADIQWLAVGDEANHAGQYGFIPLYDAKIAADRSSWRDGATILATLALTRYRLHELHINEEHCSAFRVDGDSMEPTLSKEDVVLVDHRQQEVTGDDIYVIRLDCHLYAKRLRRLPGNIIEIISDNRHYPPIRFESEESRSLEVIGKVIYRAGAI